MRRIHPALEVMMTARWDTALGLLHTLSVPEIDVERLKPIDAAGGDRDAVQAAIGDLVEYLFSIDIPQAGRLALAWQLLTVDPRKPFSFVCVLPQVQHALDISDDLDERSDAALRERIRIWWRAAEGEWSESEVSIFRVADVETSGTWYGSDPEDDEQPDYPMKRDVPRTPGKIMDLFQVPAPRPADPSLVVMPAKLATKLNTHNAPFKVIVDAPLPLVVARDISRIRAALHREFPHATVAVDLLMRDLREGKPVRLAPLILLGSSGSGKSRLVRRLVALIDDHHRLSSGSRMHLHRFDCASSADGHFSGTDKAWGNTEASVPARAVLQGRIANPIVMLDEIDKATSNHHGGLHSALLLFLDLETARRYRDQSLDAELNLAFVSFVATANDVSKLPAPLRDRLRIVKVPDPGLQHLPQLAAQVMRDLSIEDEARQADPPLAGDELAIIGKAWARAGFSMRKLQKIVAATLEARDSYAPRH